MKAKLMVKTEMEIQLPTLPNFIRTPGADVGIPLADLTEDQVREIGRAWAEALVQKFQAKRKEKIRSINKKMPRL